MEKANSDSSTFEKQTSSRMTLDGFHGLENVLSQDDGTNKNLKLQKFKLRFRSNVIFSFNITQSGVEHVQHSHQKDKKYEAMKKKRKSTNNIKSSKKSKLHKQEECEELKAKAKTLKLEVSTLTEQLKVLLQDSATLNNENISLMGELEQLCAEQMEPKTLQ